MATCTTTTASGSSTAVMEMRDLQAAPPHTKLEAQLPDEDYSSPPLRPGRLLAPAAGERREAPALELPQEQRAQDRGLLLVVHRDGRQRRGVWREFLFPSIKSGAFLNRVAMDDDEWLT
ncbi:hypothetical protein PG999_005655 [Apiospora kogelbergensis]|uniref:Uncharacterized protein n=1 Tax=Apiospora kogelbergensis TaxID=1337665 RepID=A0AAW0R2T8_9PEZI